MPAERVCIVPDGLGQQDDVGAADTYLVALGVTHHGRGADNALAVADVARREVVCARVVS